MTEPREEKKIVVPICNSCGKPHFGRKNAIDRCWCDTSGNYHMGEITDEAALPKKEEWELKYCDKCIQETNHEGDKCLKCPKKEELPPLSEKEVSQEDIDHAVGLLHKISKAQKEGEEWDWEREFTDNWPDTGDQGKIDFIRQHFISRTAVEKIIEGLIIKKESFNGNPDTHIRIKRGAYNKALRDLLEKINKE